jgi:hypothetical protein
VEVVPSLAHADPLLGVAAIDAGADTPKRTVMTTANAIFLMRNLTIFAHKI